MVVPITVCNFVVQWDKDEREWKGMVQIPLLGGMAWRNHHCSQVRNSTSLK